jgi:hypothetical protein
MRPNLHCFCLLLPGLFLTSCLVLKTHPARSLPPGTLESLGSSDTHGTLGAAIRDSHALAAHYQYKLRPVFTEMHQSAKIIGQDKQSRLLGQARGHIAEMAVLAVRARSSWQACQNSSGGSDATGMVAGIGLRLADRCVMLVDRTRQVLDLTEGYIRAGVEKNLSYLSPAHQRQFNRESSALDAASAAMMSEFDALAAALRNLERN